MVADAKHGLTTAAEATAGVIGTGILSGLFPFCCWGVASSKLGAVVDSPEFDKLDCEATSEQDWELSTVLGSVEYPFDSSASDIDEEAPAFAEESVQEHLRPNFSGRWVLDEIEGDFDGWFREVHQPSETRMPPSRVIYGPGRVVARCMHSGDSFFFVKTLVVLQKKFTAGFNVGERTEVEDDIGKLAIRSADWEGSSLILDAEVLDTHLSLEVRMYLDAHGRFVQELASSNGRSIRYVFSQSE